jgi:hypothetical protein
MANLKYRSLKATSLLSVAAIVLYAITAMAQNATDVCRLTAVIPLTASSFQKRLQTKSISDGVLKNLERGTHSWQRQQSR